MGHELADLWIGNVEGFIPANGSGASSSRTIGLFTGQGRGAVGADGDRVLEGAEPEEAKGY